MSINKFLLPIFKAEYEDIRLYIFKKNLDHIIVFCSLLTLMLTMGIIIGQSTEEFIYLSTGLLAVYILIIGAGIYIQKQKTDNIIYLGAICLVFFITTITWLILAVLTFTNIIQFYCYYIMILLMLSVFITIFPVANTIITLLISGIGGLFMLTQPDLASDHWLLLGTITIYSIISNYMRYNTTLENFNLKNQIREKNDILKLLSTKDYLTNLYTNKYVFDHLSYEIERCKRYDFPLCVMFVDVDNFAVINEKYGQVAGDETLLTIGNIVFSMCRGTDIVGRYSGKKFIVLLPNTNLEDSVIVAERIRVTIKSNTFEVGENVTVSIGLKSYNQTDIDTYIKGVELLLQEAKLNGKNRVQY